MYNEYSNEFEQEYEELGLIRDDRNTNKHYHKAPRSIWIDLYQF